MKKLNGLIGFALAVGVLSSCASKETLQASSIVPGARGQIIADEANHDNTSLTVKVEHLAPAADVAEGAKNYVVWMQPEGAENFQNLGALKVNKDYDGEYTTTVPYKKFRVLVTPESGPRVAAPTGPAVFDQVVSR